MKDILSKVFICAAGAAIGSAVTWKLVKAKYEKIAQEEIESVRAVYFSEQGGLNPNSDEEADSDEDEDDDLAEYKNLVEESDYTNDYNEEKEVDEEMIEPYVIVPEEFDENGYETVTLFCFADGVVTTTDDEVIENVDELIGEDSLTHFGEYEEDSVYVRNDNIRTDFEILRDNRKFSEVD